MIVLACAVCGTRSEAFADDALTSDGVPIQEWFQARGSVCKDCFVSPHHLVAPSSAGDIQHRFEEFHRLNPWVYDRLVQLAAELFDNGAQKIGIRMLYEVMRWQHMRSTSDPSSEFRLNDHYHSRYVRLIIDQHPEWANFFETRKLRAA